MVGLMFEKEEPMTSQTNRLSTLLLVDDDPTILRFLSKVISRSYGDHLTIETLCDPSLAQKRIDESVVDILLTDLDMPGINGLELLRYTRMRNPFTQVLLFTGHSHQDALLDALESGATDYLLKPVDQQQLIELVGQAHSRQQRWQRALAETWQRRTESLAMQSS